MNIHLLVKRRWRKLYHPALDNASLKKSIRQSFFYIVLLLSAHILAMVFFENLGFQQALWLTMVTVSTVGYGDVSAATPAGQLATLIVILVGAITLLPKLVGDYLDYRSNIRDQKRLGKWSWKMKNHIVILNAPAVDQEQYLKRLVMQFRETQVYAETSIQIVTRAFTAGLPESILNLNNVIHYHGRADEIDSLKAAYVQEAAIIIVLTKRETDKASDGRTFDIIHRLKELAVRGKILAECVDDSNRERLHTAGADVIIRPIRAYPEMTVRAFVAPGSEMIIENMFTHAGDEYLRFDLDVEKPQWADVTCALAVKDIGTAIGYIDSKDGQLHCNPPQLQPVTASAIFVVVREENIPDLKTVKAALN
ncbi:MAG: hypothetical protein GXP14_10750 [Gammaproteobacteria bacterium]|nr:hypothetical protein [Gammaproteobacteria bacterium]